MELKLKQKLKPKNTKYKNQFWIVTLKKRQKHIKLL